jgi:hypothetical protein
MERTIANIGVVLYAQIEFAREWLLYKASINNFINSKQCDKEIINNVENCEIWKIQISSLSILCNISNSKNAP